MKNLRLALAALVLSFPLAACTQQVGDDAATSTDPIAAESKVAPELTRIEAKFARWIPSPTGKTAGMLLDDGTFVRVHGDTKTDALAAGDLVQVEGIKHDATFAFASVKKGDAVIAEAPKDALHKGKHSGKHGKKHGEWKKAEGKQNHAEWKQKHAGWKQHEPSPEMAAAMAALVPMKAQGTVSTVIPGRHGKVHAVVLSDGTVAYAPRHSDAFTSVKKGDTLQLEGKGGTWAVGKSMVAETVTPVDAKPL